MLSMLFVLFCLTCGCRYWYQPDGSFENCQQDLQQCHDELKKYADMNNIGCYEVDFVKDCMREKGYTLSSESDLPKYTKRQDPRMDTFWLLAGVSGAIEE
jgi:hypothetical protein